MKTFLFLPLAAATLFGAETKYWSLDSKADFEKGSFRKLSLRSDGRIFLAPVFKELHDAGAPYLWALAEDGKSNIYAGGGSQGGSKVKLYKIDTAGKASTAAELDGLEIHAVAVDKQDRVYAATNPDGKVYRIAGSKADVFYDPKAKYIWAMEFAPDGSLYVATGDTGEIHKVSPNGAGSVFFRTDETHARSMTLDAKGNLIVGTEPGGLILRITPAGDGFVLHQASKREITAVALGSDGSIYAAAVGGKPGAATAPLAPVAPAPAPPPSGGGGAITVRASGPLAAAPATAPAGGGPVSGGSEVWRIDAEGYPHRIWSDGTDAVYAIAFGKDGKALLATGNRGYVVRVDTESLSTQLVKAEPTQITALIAGRNGRIIAGTGNIGKVFQIGPEMEASGEYESETLDAGIFSYWGRMIPKTDLGGGAVTFEARSGNLERAQKNWSPWQPAAERIVSPASRFLQWKVKLSGPAEVLGLDIAYMPRNVPPVIHQIELTPVNYKFPASSLPLAASSSITLPAFGQRRTSASASSPGDGSGVTMNYAKGAIGVRWRASDPNGDSLVFKVEIRGVKETAWKLLKDKIRERYLGWDSTAFPDGDYVVRITASDAPGNSQGQGLLASLDSDSFTIDNTPPRIDGLTAAVNGNKVTIQWKASDAASVLDKAEYSINGGEWLLAEPTTRLTDAREHTYSLTADKPDGEVTIAVRVTDEADNQSVAKIVK